MSKDRIEEIYPLSPLQAGILFHSLYAPGTGVYVTQTDWLLRGAIDRQLLRGAWQAVAERQTILRTGFVWKRQGEPLQVVHRQVAMPWHEEDWSGLAAALQDERFAELLATDRGRGFDLAKAPLMRLTLVHLAAGSCRLLWTYHHLLLDGWSAGMVIEQVLAAYHALRHGAPPPDGRAPRFSAFVSWLRAQDPAQARAFWRGHLAGFTTPTALPRARASGQTTGNRKLSFALPAAATAALAAFARRERLTLATVAQAAWALLLGRWSGQSDVLFGIVVTVRPGDLAGSEEMVGLFINTLPLRLAVPEGEPVRDWLRAVQAVRGEMRRFEHWSLLDIQGESQVPRGTPLFETLLAFNNFPAGEALAARRGGLDGLEVRSARGLDQSSYPLAVSLREAGGVFAGDLEYDGALFDGAAMRRLAGHLQTLLGALAAAAERPVCELPLLAAFERAQILVEWNDSGRPCPQRPMAHEMVRQRARRRPDAVAVGGTAGGRDPHGPQGLLAYGDLEQLANGLAHRLRSLGVGPDVAVALCTGRTLARVVGIVAVLKAGGAYVSLDPAYPRERLAYLLADAGAPVLLTERRYLPLLPAGPAAVLCLDGDEPPRAAEPPPAGVTPQNLAYIVYTSGSTGRPKGVEIPHCGMMNMLRWHRTLYRVRPGDRATQVASPAFDASIWELWPYITAGASVHIPDEETRLSPAAMVRWWAEVGITLAYLMTPLAEGVLEERVPEPLRRRLRVRALIIGGDRLHRGPDPGARFRLMNHYGPAEYSVNTTVTAVPPSRPDDGLPAIGRPVDNTRVYLLDREGRPVPIGVPGELHVAGIGLARGYRGRPDLTAEKFLPDPWAEEPGGRMYRTGDLVRWLPGGEIDFLGRLDHQVKLRGLRIELGEIEVVLGQHPAVREVAALVREDIPGDRRLTAYFVPAGERIPGGRELREFLAERLPDYMVPAMLMPLAALPLTPNGKVDRRALPAPDWGAQDTYAPPRGPLEELLAGIWSEVLGVARVGVHDSFFDLGGHSLLAIRVIARLREALGVELPLRALMEAATVAALAARIAGERRETALPPAPPLVAVGRGALLPLSFAQERLWFLDQLTPANAAYNIFQALELRGRLAVPALALALADLVARHEVLRTRFVAVDGRPWQAVEAARFAPPPLVDLSRLPEPGARAEARWLAAAAAGRPFDLARAPLLRVTLVRLAPQAHLALVAMHHAVSDGWSVGIFTREVSALYRARLATGADGVQGAAGADGPAATAGGSAGPAAEPETGLPALPVQYADYAAWQRAWLAPEVLRAALEPLRQRLEGAPRLEVPTDRPRRERVRARRGATRRSLWPPAAAGPALALARRLGATPFMLLLAAWQTLLARYSGQDDLVLGTPVTGRDRLETEGLIGFFVNTLALRTSLADDPTFSELVGRVREAALAAHASREVPFDRLVEALAPERGLGQAPLFEVVFALHHASGQSLTVPGLAVAPLPAADPGAKFELTLALTQGDGGIEAALEFDRDLFDHATAERWLRQLARLLAAAAAAPERRLAELPLLGAVERQQLLEWNDTASAYPRDATLAELFGAAAARAAERPAVVWSGAAGEHLSYGELDRRANRLARHLQRLGAGVESRVGICLERGVEMVVATLAAIKAGAAYVPLDPAYPAERLALMAEDADLAAVLTRESLVPRLPPSVRGDGAPGEAAHGARLVPLDRHGAAIAAGSAAPLPLAGGPESLAYVMYTSGSTGRPKGVAVPQRAVVRLVVGTDYLQLGGDDRVAQLASPSFDAATFEIWGALLGGGTLVGVPREALLAPAALGACFAAEQIGAAFLTTVLFDQAAREAPRAFAGMRGLLVGGDRVDAASVRRVLAAGPPRRLLNGYGPTENTTFSCSFDLATVAPDAAAVPIGRPIANSRAHVLDARLRRLPPGAVGELCVAGDGLARGYLGRPGLTGERFVESPELPGERLYRTGDIVRQLPDGNLAFLGRRDNQVKLRGFRVELEEVEAAVAALDGVAQAAVVARDDLAGGRALVAYVVPAAEGGAATVGAGWGEAARAMRQRLRGQLPEFMVPAFFVPLPALPLGPAGKLDRRALAARGPLPAPGERPRTEPVSPRTPVEELVAALFAEVLEVERVDAEDDFFALGGHSLMATRLTSRLRGAFGVELPLAELFAGPTVAQVAAAVERALRGGALEERRIERAPRDGPLPLSFAQERLWFLQRLSPAATAYNIPLAVALDGELSPAALAWSFSAVVRRHEALRTTFAPEPAGAVQRVAAPAPVALPLADLSRLPAPVREAERRRLMAAFAARPFDLERGPLLRLLLLALAPGRHLLFAGFHHIVADGWSMGVLVRELGALYAAGLAGRPEASAGLPALPIQYADWSAWQRAWLQGETLAAELAWWRERLAGAPPLLELPTDRPRPALPSWSGASCPVALDEALTGGLRRLCREQRVTLFMALLAGFDLLLARYAGQTDVAVGTPVAGRTRLETEALIGFFINLVVLRADLAAPADFGALLAQIRARTLAAYAHQDLPFEKLVEELQPERNLAHTPLFQVVFALLNAPRAGLVGPGLRFAMLPIDNASAKFDLSLSLTETGDRLEGGLEYRRELFDRPTLLRLAGHLAVLLGAAAAAPAAPLGSLPLLAAAEQAQLLREWNDNARDWPPGLVHERVTAHARRRPEALAVGSFDGTRLSYRGLEAWSNRMAHALRALGVGPEVPVALCTGRCAVERVAAALAVLKAGGAYVALDPSHPAERLAFQLADAGAPVVLGERRWLDLLPATGARVIALDAPPFAGGPAEDPDPGPPASGVEPGNLAYVVYTSGSTGRPKGVEIPHAGLANLVHWYQERFTLRPGDRGTQVASPAFDASVVELWPFLAGGGEIHIPDEADRLSPAGTLRWWAEHGITHGYLMTPLAEGVLEELEGRAAADCALPLRSLFTGGDRLHHRPGPEVRFRLWNTYGPAEYSVTTSATAVAPAEGAGAPLPTIGRPLPNTRVYVLDPLQQAVPAGVPGELCVAGVGLARGYHGRPGLTAERFLPDPWSPRPGERMYRTGDLTRLLPDGDLDFLGRTDHQVKLRGFRIELGEIESVLGQHPAVREAAALVREDRPGDRRLAAYLVGAVAARPAAEELRAFLRQRLPAHMIPAAWVWLDRLPLSANGKIDRSRLPAPDWAAQAAYVAPTDPLQQLLAGIWAEVLGVERVGRDDDFFALGGHSLLATRMIARVSQALGVEVPLRALFEHPTLGGLAESLAGAAADAAGRGPAPPPLVRAERPAEVPLSFAQERLWFLDRLEPGSVAYNVPWSLRLEGRLEPAVLRHALGQVAARHEALRTSFPARDGVPVQRIAAPAPAALPVLDLAGLPSAARQTEAARLSGAEARRPFDLGSGPLMRASVVRLSPARHLVLLTLHHIVTDGWSMPVLTREVAACYEAGLAGRRAALPDLAVQYADFALWQRRWLDGERLAAEVEHWRRQLAGAPPLLALPLDRPRPARRGFDGGRVRLAVPAPVHRALRELSRREGVTLFMLLAAALGEVLARACGQDDVPLGTPVSGRNRVETEELIGLFINTLVLRADLGGRPTVAAALRRLRETVLEAHAHQDVPFEKLVAELAPERSLSHSPLFQVMLLVQPPLAPQQRLSGLTLTALVADNPTPKFDLSVGLAESADELGGTIEYDRALFDGATVGRLGARLVRLLAAMAAMAPTTPADGAAARPPAASPTAAGGERCLRDLDLLDDAERAQLLWEWNDTGPAEPDGATIDARFRAQAARAPGAPALIAGGDRLTYGELARRVRRLARLLSAHGVGVEARAGVCLRRSADLVAALLAVLEAGGAYVPLDPAYPAERLAFMLADSGARLLLTERAVADRLPLSATADAGAAAGPDVLWIDDVPAPGKDRDAAGRAPGRETTAALAALAHRIPPAPGAGETDLERLAYVIYTSGSTGQPKGVAIPHRGPAALARWAEAAFSAAELAGVLASTSVCFDLSVFELLIPLALGGTVVLAENALALPALAAADEVSLVNTVPSVLAELLRPAAAAAGEDGTPPRGLPGSVRTVCLAGEALGAGLARAVAAAGPRIGRVLNLYGPSEDTTYSTMALVGGVRGTGGAGGAPPIGRSLDGRRALVLDLDLRPVPIGVAGELCVGGAGLARGYLGQPALTAERFIPSPAPLAAGERLYRTGDLARRLPGGELDYLGRADHQIKLRGFRIELGEIEAVLAACPGVRQAAVLAVGESGPDRRLVACVAADDEAEDAALRGHLARRLPQHMLPAELHRLAELPLTANGKIDRRVLAAAAGGRGRLPASRVAPRGALEELVAGFFAEVLERPEVGAHDDFFALGGHSLLATRVISRLREACGVEVPLARLFASPTPAALAAAVGEALRDGRPGAVTPPLLPVPRDRPLPLSFAQERMWFLDRLAPRGAAYNMPLALRLTGRLEPRALAWALGEVVRRHEVLRTTFTLLDGAPVQVIADGAAAGGRAGWRLARVDLRALAAAAREDETRRLAAADARRPFDLERGPLLRAMLLQLADGDQALLANVHHAVSDGWSLEVLLREVAALHAAAGRPDARGAVLPPLPVQYADYAVWQRGWLTGEVLAAEVAHWRGELAGAPPLLALATDRPRPAVQTQGGGTAPVRLPAALPAALAGLARRERATPFMILLAGFQVLLARWSGQSEVVVGTPVAGRNRLELEPLIGCFVNTLALRGRVDAAAGFGTMLRGARERVLTAHAHQEVPFEKLVEELAPERRLSHSPIFQAMFTLQHAIAAPATLAGLTVSALGPSGGTAKFDLTLGLAQAGEQWQGAFEYNADLFDRATLLRLARSFAALLGEAVAEPLRPLGQIRLLGEAERAQLLREWNDTDLPAADGATVDARFRARAARAPAALALIAGDGRLTYGGLAWRVRGLARRLAARGVGPEVRVGVCLRRAPDLVAALLAVLEAGGAYVPLDPAYPAERLAFMLADSGARLLLTERAVADRLPLSATADAGAAAGPDVLWIDDVPAPGKDRDAAGRAPGRETTAALAALAHRIPLASGAGETDLERLAYVIYTSGSTGQPKGVAIPHRGPAALARWAEAAFSAAELAGVLASTSVCFDLSVFELLIPLALGGTVVLAENVLALSALAAADEVSLVNTVPSVLAELLRPAAGTAGEDGTAPRGLPGSVRTVCLAGEALGAGLARAVAAAGPRIGRVLNLYGPSEDTTYSTMALVGGVAEIGGAGTPPIGRSLAGRRAFVLDGDLQPVPIGVAGELCVGGAGLARGYLGRPELTAERFVPSPTPRTAGERLYRTGDLARRHPDGDLEYLGRADHQVKLRGFRIELGEVEAALAGCPGVRQAAVLLRGETALDRRLVGYVAAEGEGGGALALRARLALRLPEHMIPGELVHLPGLPLTASGKIDRRALAALAPGERAPEGSYVPARDGLELGLVRLWEEILPRRPIGIDDDFFALGGHSLLGVRMLDAVERRFHRRLPLASLFQGRTVERLAELLRRQPEAGTEEERPGVAAAAPPAGPLVAVRGAGSERPLFCVHPSGGGVFCYLPLASRLPRELPVYGLQARGLEPGESPDGAIEAMSARYVAAVRGACPHGPYFLSGWSMGGVVALEMAQQLRAAGEAVALLALLDTRAPAVFAARPLDRLDLLASFALELGLPLDQLAVPRRELAELPPAEVLARLGERAQDAGLLPPATGLVSLERRFEVFAANVGALRSYTARPYQGPVVILRAAEADGEAAPDPRLGWDGIFGGGLAIEEVPGNHFTMVREPHVAALAARLQTWIERTQQES